jgi:hypothetical protein
MNKQYYKLHVQKFTSVYIALFFITTRTATETKQQLKMDSNASTPATLRREHMLLQNLGHHHHHLVSIQSNISNLRTTHFSIHFSILHILISVTKQYAFLEKNSAVPVMFYCTCRWWCPPRFCNSVCSLLWVAGVEALLSIFSCCLVSVAVLVVMKCSYS